MTKCESVDLSHLIKFIIAANDKPNFALSVIILIINATQNKKR